jgi:hypothetical protein
MAKTISHPGKYLEDTGLLFEINLVVLHKHGISAWVNNTGQLVLTDFSEHEGGVVFTNDEIRTNTKTFVRLQQGNQDRLVARRRILGHVRQNLHVPQRIK